MAFFGIPIKKKKRPFDNDASIASKIRFRDRYGTVLSFCRDPFSFFNRCPPSSFLLGAFFAVSAGFLFRIASAGVFSKSPFLPFLPFPETALLFVSFFFFLPFLYFEEKKQKRIESAESDLPLFLGGLSDLLAGGLTLPEALTELTAEETESGLSECSAAFQKDLRLVGLKTASGIPFEICLDRLGQKYDSGLIRRAASVIEAAEKSGGRPELSVRAAAFDLTDTVTAKKEQNAKQSVHGTVLFVSFFLFIAVAVLLILQFKSMDSFLTSSVSSPLSNTARLLFHMLLIQAFFAGLTVGKLKTGNAAAGLKSSFGLMFAVWAAFTAGGVFIG